MHKQVRLYSAFHMVNDYNTVAITAMWDNLPLCRDREASITTTASLNYFTAPVSIATTASLNDLSTVVSPRRTELQ